MMIELEPSFWNRTRKQNDKSARGHETAHRPFSVVPELFSILQLETLNVAVKCCTN